MKFSLFRFWLSWDQGSLYSFDSPPPLLKCECLSYNCSTIVFWKQITGFVVSQIHRWREILSLGRSKLESHPYLIWIIYVMRCGTLCVYTSTNST